MATFAERTELESQPLNFGASNKVWVAVLEVRRHGQEEGIALQGRSPSLALRRSAEAGFWSVRAPASLAPPTEQRLASRSARNERREVKVNCFDHERLAANRTIQHNAAAGAKP
jgi:hypothetical protein